MRNKLSHGIAVLLFVVGFSPSSADDNFKAMFNGNDFSGWVRTNTPSQTWSYQDGLLVCSGKPIGEIRTEKMYQNFIMELEWRHLVPRGNAGVFVWADDITSRGVPFHRGIEIQILESAYGDSKSHTTHGDIFPIHGATMTPINGRGGSRAFPVELLSNPSPQWNHYRIEARDGELSLAVNGKVVTRGKECTPRKGYICLESEGGIVHYRNVRIQELPPTDISPDQVAIADRGYRSLYTGLDLSGWKKPAAESHWEVADWVLSYKGDERQPSELVSTETFEKLGFVVDVRLKSATSNAIVQTNSTTRIDLSEPRIAKHLQAANGWNRIEASEVDGKFSITVNGNSVDLLELATPTSDDAITLVATGPVDFCNIYARSMNKQP